MKVRSCFSLSVISILIATVLLLGACGAKTPAPVPQTPQQPAQPQATSAPKPGAKLAPVIGKEIDTSNPLADDLGPLKVDMPQFMTYSGTSSPSSLYTFLSDPMLKAMKEAFPGTSIRHLPGGTSVNPKRAGAGEADFFVSILPEISAATYSNPTDYPTPLPVSLMAALPTKYHNSAPIVLPGSPIKSLNDIKGKRVTPIYATSSIYRFILPSLLASHGWTYADIDARVASGDWREDSFNKLFNNETDMIIWSLIIPDPFVSSKELMRELVLVDLTDAECKAVTDNNPGYYQWKMPVGSFKFVNKDKPQNAIGMAFAFGAANKLPEEVVWNILWAAFRNDSKPYQDAHPGLAGLDFIGFQDEPSMQVAPWHPGAKKYWEARGLKLPPILPKPAAWTKK